MEQVNWPDSALGCEIRLAYREALKAKSLWPDFHSAHEGFVILKEEVDELWEHVKTNQRQRDLGEMKKKAIQVAAMALRFAAEVCSEDRGRI